MGLLHGKPASLVTLYVALEERLKRLRRVEIVARDRYALFRTTPIFADLVFMSDALRLAIHLGREVRAPCFFKVQRGSAHRVAHVAKLRNANDLRTIIPYLEEAYHFATSEESEARSSKSARPARPRR